jgi:MarR family 2-MHQ and catechol resistance regulon transcriptional repressor
MTKTSEDPQPDEIAYVDSLTNRYVQLFPWVDPSALRLFFMLQAAGQARSAAFSRFFQSLAIDRTPGRYSVLRVLYFAQGPIRLSDIRSDMNISAANVSVLVDGLQRDGLVRRVANETDRRSTYVELTEDGKTLCASVVPKMAQAIADLCSEFSEPERASLTDLLGRFVRAAETDFRD